MKHLLIVLLHKLHNTDDSQWEESHISDVFKCKYVLSPACYSPVFKYTWPRHHCPPAVTVFMIIWWLHVLCFCTLGLRWLLLSSDGQRQAAAQTHSHYIIYQAAALGQLLEASVSTRARTDTHRRMLAHVQARPHTHMHTHTCPWQTGDFASSLFVPLTPLI